MPRTLAGMALLFGCSRTGLDALTEGRTSDPGAPALAGSGGAGTAGSPDGSGGAPSGHSGVAGNGGEPAAGRAGSAGGSGTGGASGASAGQAGAADAGTPRPQDLAGDYDLTLNPLGQIGCLPTFDAIHLNLKVIVATDGSVSAVAFKDYFWDASIERTATLDASELTLPAYAEASGAPLSPELHLFLDEHGFTGTGTAVLHYPCGSPEFDYRAPVTLTPDATPPKLRLEPAIWGGLLTAHVYGFTKYGFTFSEPVTLPSGRYQDYFEEPTDGAAVVDFYDTLNDGGIQTYFRTSLAGPIAQASLLLPSASEGRTLAARAALKVTDSAGNAALSAGQSFDVLPAAHFTGLIDFDDGPSPGAWGNATYVASGEPCESGGCLVLEGAVPNCSEQQAPPATFALLHLDSWDTSFELRFRLWSSDKLEPGVWFGYASGCLGELDPVMSPLATPDGALNYASDWQTTNVAPCGGYEYENGVLFAFGCSNLMPAPAARLVIERIGP